jgi:hypothetical protein
VTGEWRKLHNEELRDLYSAPNIIRMIKTRRIRCARYVARIGENSKGCRILMGSQKGKDHKEEQNVDG